MTNRDPDLPDASGTLPTPPPGSSALDDAQTSSSVMVGLLGEDVSAKANMAFPVVGVGASAGGLVAVTQLLQALPADTGASFVIIQHLAPDVTSNLSEILSRSTLMPVCEVCDEPEVEPDHVYVIPPGRDMIIAGGKLVLLEQDRYARRRGIDQFFCSLAEECGHKAIGVVLSGAMSDGTLGLEAIKAAGGITFAQNDSAQHDSMPRSAVASGCVDFVLPPDQIAHEIARIARHPYVAPARSEALVEDASGHVRIAEIVHRALGVDFTHYKTNTLLRRIARRMVLHKMTTMREYEDYLRRDPAEVEALFRDILISVTTFFRDPESCEALAQTVFPKLFAGRTRQEPVRIWTLGCSTGEEAYSLAMVYAECAEVAGSDVPLQLFATDLNSICVEKARTGVYPASIEQHVSPTRLQRFFTKEEAGYRICKDIRERCIFSRHNVLVDPPFSRVDLISCRNLLIYMEPVLQKQIMTLLHYSLKPGGHLWLGRSETAGASRALFDVEDVRNKIFVRRVGRSVPGLTFRAALGGGRTEPFLRAAPGAPLEVPRHNLPKEAERILLAKYVPPGVVISAAMEIVQFRGDTGPYLAPAAGAPSLHLLKMLREGLLVGVRAAILRAGEEARPVREERLRVQSDQGFRELAVEVIPIKVGDVKQSGFLVLFDEHGKSDRGSLGAREDSPVAPATADKIATTTNDEIIRLTQELAATREYLQAVIEQHEAVNEELQSANEESQSANEEMQSVNEELETSKEEIQSSNEELATVNDELNSRNLELSLLNTSLRVARNYAESIVANIRSPLLVLDAEFRVKTASAAFYETFQVSLTATEGRLIYDLGNGQWNIAALRKLLEELLPQNHQIDDYEVRHSFENIGFRTMVLNAQRLVPAADNEALIVLAIEDVTERARADQTLRESQDRLRHAADAAGLTYVEVDFARSRLRAAENFAAVMGYALPLEEAVDTAAGPRLLLDHVIALDRPRVEAALQDFLQGKAPGKIVYRVRGDDQVERWIESVWSTENGPDGKPLRSFATNLDISEMKLAEEHGKLLMAEVNHRAKNLLAVVQAIAQQTVKHADPATFVKRLTDRIEGLTTSQDLLVQNNWRGVDVSRLVEGQLAHFKDLIGKRILLMGPTARLTPAAAQGIGMALHELATNASKYGSLSNKVGRVHISWKVAEVPTPIFTMRWLEEGGPKVELPTRRGFGQTVIGRMAESAVDGTVEVEYRESGLSWQLSAPVAGTIERERDEPST